MPAQAVLAADTSSEQLVSTQTGLSLSVVQKYISQGYTPEEIQSAYAIATSSNADLNEVLSNSRKTIATADQVPDPIDRNEILPAKGGVKTFLTDSGTSNTIQNPTVDLPDLTAKFDEAPYKVALSNANVSTLSGGVSVEAVDMTLVGVNGLNFTLKRSYNSDSANYYDMDVELSDDQREYVNKTKTSYQEKMYPIGAGWSWDIPSIEVVGDTGKRYLHMPGGGAYEIKNETTLVGYPWKGYMLRDSFPICLDTIDGMKYFFDNSEGYLIQISDAYGNNIYFSYSGEYNNKKLRVIYNNISSIIFSYTENEVRIKQGERTVIYTKEKTPDADGKEILRSVTDEGGRVTKYGYAFKPAKFDLLHANPNTSNPYALLTQINHPTGAQTLLQYEDTPFKRCIDTRTAAFKEVYRAKSIENQVNYTDGSKSSYNKSVVSYNGDMGESYLGTGTFSTTIDDGLTKTTYDYEKELGKYYYNTQITTVDKSTPTTSTIVKQTYDRVRKLPVPNTVSKQVVTSAGKADTVVTNRTYDEFGNVITEVDPMNVMTTYTYSGRKPASITKPISDSLTMVTSFVYNDKKSVIQATTTTSQQPNTILAQVKFAYDNLGNIVEARTLEDGKEILETYGYKYNGAYLSSITQKVTDVDNVVTTISKSYDYDPVLGRLTKSTDGNGNTTTYEYDILGRLKKQTNPDKSTVTLAYDDLNNRIEQTNELGQKTRVQWNPLGMKLKTEVYQDGQYKTISKNDYDLFGRPVVVEDGEKHQTKSTYDNFSRISQTTFADATKISYQYDDLKNTKTGIDPDQNTVRETFDKMGHSVLKELLKTPTQPVVMERQNYDVYGNLVSAIDGNNNTTTYQYDAFGRLAGVTDALQQNTKYKYDNRGDLTQITYPDGKTVQKKYDDLGRMIQQTDALNQVTKNYYDANGNLISQKDRNNQTIQLQYNARNQLIQKSIGATAIQFEYDLSGHRTKMTDETGATSYNYDGIGQLSSVTYPDGKSISYTYDGNGNVTSLKEPFGKTYTYALDDRNRVNAVYSKGTTSPADVQYQFTKGGAIQAATLQNGISSSYEYNESNFIKSETQKKSDNTPLVIYGYTYDTGNNQTSKKDNNATYNF